MRSQTIKVYLLHTFAHVHVEVLLLYKQQLSCGSAELEEVVNDTTCLEGALRGWAACEYGRMAMQ
eukprot:4612057-Amphidinium_carterae.1